MSHYVDQYIWLQTSYLLTFSFSANFQEVYFVLRAEKRHGHMKYQKLHKSHISGWVKSRVVLREQGWRSGESVVRLKSVCLAFDSRTWRHMWLEFVVGSLLCSEMVFSDTPSKIKNYPNPIQSWNALVFLNEFLWTLWCIVGKQIICMSFLRSLIFLSP